MKRAVWVVMLICFAYIKPVQAQEVTVPFNVGVGPTFNWLTGPVADDQTFHFGLRFSTYIAIDRPTRMKYMKHIPKKFRKLARQKGEIRYDPVPWYVPRSFFISPKVGDGNTGVYGLTFRPLGIGIALGELRLGLGALLTYAYIHSDTIPSPTHFLRPGIEIKADFEIPLQRRRMTALSIGWASQFYIPQEIGGAITEVGDLDTSVWHNGQIMVMLHKRFNLTLNVRDYL